MAQIRISGNALPPDLQQTLVAMVIPLAADAVLQHAHADFQTKSEGGQGLDGVTWPPTTAAGILSRAQRDPAWAALLQERREITEEERDVMSEIRASGVLRKGDEWAQYRRNYIGNHPEWKSVHAARQEIRGRQQQVINKHDTGVTGIDTSSLLDSLVPGAPGNVREIHDNSATVGTQVEHAGYFDRLRPVFPETLPVEFLDSVEEQLRPDVELMVQQLLE